MVGLEHTAVESRELSARPASAESDPRTSKLDRVATTLIGAVAAVGGLLAVFGVNSDRISVLLDDRQARFLLLGSGLSAVVAICLSLLALMSTRVHREVTLLAGGAIAYVAGLTFSIFAAAGAADYAGRPSITNVNAQPGIPASLTLIIRGASLDEDDRISIEIVDDQTEDILYSGTMSPDSGGRVEQQVAFPVPEDAEKLLLQAWRLDITQNRPSCENVAAYVTCAYVSIPR